jgi:hypothetical protein
MATFNSYVCLSEGRFSSSARFVLAGCSPQKLLRKYPWWEVIRGHGLASGSILYMYPHHWDDPSTTDIVIYMYIYMYIYICVFICRQYTIYIYIQRITQYCPFRKNGASLVYFWLSPIDVFFLGGRLFFHQATSGERMVISQLSCENPEFRYAKI